MAIECKNSAYYYREFDSESLRFTEEYPNVIMWILSPVILHLVNIPTQNLKKNSTPLNSTSNPVMLR